MAEENKSPDARVFINGSEVPAGLQADIRESKVTQHVDGPSCFEVIVNILNGENQELKWVDEEIFKIGTALEIRMGYLDRFETVIAGEITALHPKFPATGTAILHVQGFDRMHRMQRGRRTRSFFDRTDSQVAEEIGGEHGFTVSVDDSGFAHPYLLQNNLSDLAFLQLRAQRIGFELKAVGNELRFKRRPYHLSAGVDLAYPATLKWFYPRMSASGSVGRSEVPGWNVENKEAVLGVAEADSLSGKMGDAFGFAQADQAFGEQSLVETSVAVINQGEANQIALGQLQAASLGWIEGEGETVGNPLIRAGEIVEIGGVGARFSGAYYLESVEHTVSPELGFRTHFLVRRNAS